MAGPPFGVPKSQVKAVVKTGFPGAEDTSPTPTQAGATAGFLSLSPGPRTGEQKQKQLNPKDPSGEFCQHQKMRQATCLPWSLGEASQKPYSRPLAPPLYGLRSCR